MRPGDGDPLRVVHIKRKVPWHKIIARTLFTIAVVGWLVCMLGCGAEEPWMVTPRGIHVYLNDIQPPPPEHQPTASEIDVLLHRTEQVLAPMDARNITVELYRDWFTCPGHGLRMGCTRDDAYIKLTANSTCFASTALMHELTHVLHFQEGFVDMEHESPDWGLISDAEQAARKECE